MGKIIINTLCTIIIFSGIYFVYSYLEKNNVIDKLLEYYEREHTVLSKNNYNLYTENKFVQVTDDFEPDDRQDILNIYYTVLASGMDRFVFFCSEEYYDCTNDVQLITDDNLLLSHINNFVHPFNSYKSIRTSYTNGGKVTIDVNKLYANEKVDEINKKIDQIFPTLVSSSNTAEENIKSIHDYIVNNSKYDSLYVENTSPYESNDAYGPLFQGYAICSGYTDLMAIFLDRLGITNHKISNDKHVWNLIYLNGEWLHLDLTWDDPVATNGKDYLKHDYFLITTDELMKLDAKEGKTEHIYDKTVYEH